MGERIGEPRRILMVVPHRVRDLEGHALVAYYLRKKYGHEVAFSGVDELAECLLADPPDAVVLDFLGWTGRADVARLAKSLDARVALLPIAGLYETKEEFIQEAGKLTEASALADLYLSWGEYGRRAVLEAGLFPESSVHTTGCPRFDFYRPPFLALVRSKADLLDRLPISNPDAPLILWTTNTPHASRHEERHARGHRKHRRLPEDEVRIAFRDEKRQFAENSRVVASLARRHSEWTFLIKVHPLEDVLPYQKLASAIPNLHVTYDAPIRDFLVHCHVLLQRGCTTATEAWMLGKPVLELDVGQYEHTWTPKEFRAGLRVVTTLAEADTALVEAVRDRSIPLEQRQAQDAFLSEYYYRVDGRASERVALRLHGLVSSRPRTPRDVLRARDEFRRLVSERETDATPSWQHRLRDVAGMSRDTSLRFWKTWRRRTNERASREITDEMVEELWKRFDRILSEPSPGTAPEEATGS
jgi:surface carbohydrate biosynthesis protein